MIRLVFHNQLKLLLIKCPFYRFTILIFYFVNSRITINSSVYNKNFFSPNLFMGDFLMLNLTNSLTLNLLLSLCLWKSLFSYRFTQNLAFLFLLASLAAILILLLKDALYFDEMSGRISIYLLGFFSVNYRNMIPVMVWCNLSTIWDFRSLCLENSFMLLFARYDFTKTLKKFCSFIWLYEFWKPYCLSQNML